MATAEARTDASGSSSASRLWARLRGTDAAPSPSSDAAKELAKRLAAGGALLTGLFALLGITGSQLDRLLRNEPGGAVTMLGLIAFGVLAGITVATAGDDLEYRHVFAAAAAAALVTIVFVMGYTIWRGDAHVALFWLLPSVCLLLLAVGTVTVVSWGSPRGLVVLVGTAALLAGLGGVGVLAIDSKAAKDRPAIEATLVRDGSGWVMEAQVTARGLTSREHIVVHVQGLSALEPFDGRRAGRWQDIGGVADVRNGIPPGNDFHQTILFTHIGPDIDGSIDTTVRSPVSVGLYERVRVSARLATQRYTSLRNDRAELESELRSAEDADDARIVELAEELREFDDEHREELDTNTYCDELRVELSCVVIAMPQGAVRPALTLAQDPEAGSITVRVRADDVNPDDVVEVLAGHPDDVRLRSLLSAGATGAIDETLPIPVGAGSGRLCAVARIVELPAVRLDRADVGHLIPGAPAGHLEAACPTDGPQWSRAYVEMMLGDP